MRILGFEIKFPRALPSSERRREERIPVHQTLYLDYEGAEPHQKGTAEVLDISISGVRFACDLKLPRGTFLNFTLRFPPGFVSIQNLKVRGSVVRCHRKFHQKRHRVACAFDRLDASSLEQIQAFIRWLKERKEKFLFFRYGN